MPRYLAQVRMTAETEFEFTDEDIEVLDSPESAALDLLFMDFAGTDPFGSDVDYDVIIEVLDGD